MTRALVVDDKEENLYLLRALLQGHGFSVEEARHGAEALTKARQSPPELIISDLLMPVMDGYALLRHWKDDARLKKIPFVVYTATYTEPKDEQLALDLGADAFIIKPAEPDLFMARIVEVLGLAAQGGLLPVNPPGLDEEVLLRKYSEVLVGKLEESTRQLEKANRELLADLVKRAQADAERERLLAETERARAGLLSILEDQRLTEAALKDSSMRHAHLAHRLIGLQEEERTRIARELHDELGQSLTAAKLRLQSPPSEANLTAAVTILDEAIGRVRGMSLDLYPPQLTDLGLTTALRSYIARSYSGVEPRVDFESSGALPAISQPIALVTYRIAQEAIGNAVRHSGAKSIRVELRADNDALFLEVTDDGAGFDTRLALVQALSGKSLGLVSMEERAKLSGGELQIRSVPGTGTTVSARLPL